MQQLAPPLSSLSFSLPLYFSACALFGQSVAGEQQPPDQMRVKHGRGSSSHSAQKRIVPLSFTSSLILLPPPPFPSSALPAQDSLHRQHGCSGAPRSAALTASPLSVRRLVRTEPRDEGACQDQSADSV